MDDLLSLHFGASFSSCCIPYRRWITNVLYVHVTCNENRCESFLISFYLFSLHVVIILGINEYKSHEKNVEMYRKLSSPSLLFQKDMKKRFRSRFIDTEIHKARRIK